ncbi:ABC transporter permease [Actinokineospora sp.]|uniref:ABC transporter permease n=1 Tax=Actinokineospora sp. TaxID=1872133 RepID=UPI004037DAD8
MTPFVVRWGAFAVLVGVWQWLSAAAYHPYFPTPVEIVSAAGRLWFSGPASNAFFTPEGIDGLLTSLGRAVGGWAIAVVIGVCAGVGLGLSKRATIALGPVFAFFRSLPLPALVPVFVLVTRLGTEMVLTVIVFGAVWAVLLNTVDGVRSVDRVTLETARVFRTPWPRQVIGVILPAAAAKILAGLRVSLSQSLILLVVAELFAPNGGLGAQLRDAQNKFDFPAMWAVILMLGVLGYVLNTALLLVERRMPHCRQGPAKAA